MCTLLVLALGGHVAGYVGTEEERSLNGLMIVDTFHQATNYDNSEHKKTGL